MGQDLHLKYAIVLILPLQVLCNRSTVLSWLGGGEDVGPLSFRKAISNSHPFEGAQVGLNIISISEFGQEALRVSDWVGDMGCSSGLQTVEGQDLMPLLHMFQTKECSDY